MEQQNFRNGNNTLWLALLIMALFFICCSCGSRKVDKSKKVSKEVSKVEVSKVDSSKTVTVSDSNTKIVDLGTEEEFTVVPIDSTKEMVVSGNTYKNAVLKHRKVQKNKLVDKSENITETKQNDVREASKSENSKSATIEVKNSERKSSYWWLLWLLLLIPGYLYYRKWGFRLP